MGLNSAIEQSIRSAILSYQDNETSPFKIEAINDFWVGLVSRELSLQGRREVLTGKAKFGIFGDGKELPQLAMARAFRKGDYRSGYYRDQTLMMALGITTVEDFLSQMYSDAEHDPYSGGRQMNSHFATPFIGEDGEWVDQKNQYNVSSDISCTAGQMGRALGLAMASKKYQELGLAGADSQFSADGQEVCFCTIGDASTSEGVFWETINAAAVMQVPLVVAVWDDGYGISVPTELQTAKGSISKAAKGFAKKSKETKGVKIYKVKGYDYPELCITFDKAAKMAREEHVPVLIHVKDLTQPQGHSTSGSHERYKSKQRLVWEAEYDGLKQMQKWLIARSILTEDMATELRREARSFVRTKKQESWKRFQGKNDTVFDRYVALIDKFPEEIRTQPTTQDILTELKEQVNPTRNEVLANARQMHYHLNSQNIDVPASINDLIAEITGQLKQNYSTHLYSTSAHAAINIPVISPTYSDESPEINGYQIINKYFDTVMGRDRRVIAFGEDVGHIGDVNQGMAGLQAKHGVERVFDTGIREWTIIGQGMGAAMRGLRPIAEIQYLDYLAYALPILTDDLATLRYRSNNLQQAPLIIRTRGHRLEGIWHTGSPMGMMLHALRGIYILTPRNMVQAAGMYNTLLQADDPAIVVECLNGYRLKETLPDNIGEYTVPIGLPEIMTTGEDVTLVTYGSCVRIAAQATKIVEKFGISVELIDAQTLIPFDMEEVILSSLKKTNKILFLDEDVPGGATAYMMQKVIEEQGGFYHLDAAPRTLTAQAHRTPYGSDGDYYAKPQVEDVVDALYELVFEVPYKYR